MSRKPTEPKPSESPSTGKKRAASGTGRKLARKKPGRPKKREIENREALERDIMGILAPGYQRPVPPALSKDEIMSKLVAAKLQNSQEVTTENVIRTHEQIFLEVYAHEQEQARNRALRQLVFYDGEEEIDTDKFLRRLLPEKGPSTRRILLKETIHQIPRAIMKYFVAPATGWPKEHLAEVLETPLYIPGLDALEDSYHKICENQVSFENAQFMAPFILSWARLTSSPAFRGSRRAIQKKNATKAQDYIEDNNGGATA